MKFKNCELNPVNPFVNATLYMNYNDKRIFNASIGSICKQYDGYLLAIKYRFTFHTLENELIQEYIGLYKCKVERENQSEDDEKIDLWEHIRNGLILALNAASGNDDSLRNEVLIPKKWHKEIENAYSEIIHCV